MTRRIALFAPLFAFAALSPLGAQVPSTASPAAPAPTPPAVSATARVAMITELGTIELDLDLGRAPVTAGNFLKYVDQKRLDGVAFYRVMRLDWGTQPNGLIQAGTRADPRRDLPPIAHEPTSKTGLSHVAGAISMARFAPGTAKGDFTIMISPMHGLDADPAAADADRAAGYAVFGHVSAGMDVARKIFDVPLSQSEGLGVMKGQMIEKPVKVISMRRVAIPAPAASP